MEHGYTRRKAVSDTNHFGKFTGHVIAATVSFLVIAVAALVIFYLVVFMESQGVGRYATELLSVAENTIITVDVGTYLVVLGRSVYRLISELWNE